MPDWWNSEPLSALSRAQWEALCDGCGRCCLHKLQDADTGQVVYTSVRCRYLCENTCRCTDYANRSTLVPDCLALHSASNEGLSWLPKTCAYRLRADNKPLPDWHPLVSGDTDSVHSAGISIKGRAISDEHVHPDGYDEHIMHWVK